MAANDCPNCKVPMKRYMHCYECQNCGHERPIRAYKHQPVITPSQQKAIDYCKAEIIHRAAIVPEDVDKYEWKKCEIELQPYGAVSLVLEVGKKGDEKTLGSIYCRRHYILFIGRQGAITAFYKGKTVRGWRVFHSYT